MLTKDDFERAALDKPRMEKVTIPGIGEVFIRVLSARARDGFDASVFDGETRNVDNLSARLVVLCLCDETGKVLFPDARAGAATLGNMPTAIIEMLYNQCRALNGIGVANVAALAKNSAATTESDSSTA